MLYNNLITDLLLTIHITMSKGDQQIEIAVTVARSIKNFEPNQTSEK